MWRTGSPGAWSGSGNSDSTRLLKAALTPPYEWRELLRQCDAVGAQSLPLVALAGAATGVVLSLQTRDSLVRFGAKSYLPAIIVFSLIKESGPVITGLVVSGRAGAGIGAELGSMKVTEQIDAMEASAVDPYKYLAATRVLACILMLPLLTLAANFCGILMGWLANTCCCSSRPGSRTWRSATISHRCCEPACSAPSSAWWHVSRACAPKAARPEWGARRPARWSCPRCS